MKQGSSIKENSTLPFRVVFENYNLPTATNARGIIRIEASGVTVEAAKSALAASLQLVAKRLNEESRDMSSTIKP